MGACVVGMRGVWQGGMPGRGACMVRGVCGGGACVVRGCAWWGACVAGGHAWWGHVWQGGLCMAHPTDTMRYGQ